jgi:hypothetical protein
MIWFIAGLVTGVLIVVGLLVLANYAFTSGKMGGFW